MNLFEEWAKENHLLNSERDAFAGALKSILRKIKETNGKIKNLTVIDVVKYIEAELEETLKSRWL